MNYEYLTDIEGKKKAVVVPIDDFEEMLEDIEDLAVTAERNNEETIDHNDVAKILNKYYEI